jgi:hypothetical protein
MSANQPWMKFYPRDWRGDQALRLVSLPARGLWIEMMCLMHEATPYGHLLVAGQPLSDAALARVVGSSVEEVQALLVELRAAGVCRHTRAGVVYSKRMTDDHKRSEDGRKAKLEAIENAKGNPPPSRGASRGAKANPSTQKADTRAKVEGAYSPSTLSEQTSFLGPKEVRDAFLSVKAEEWVVSYIDRCGWPDVPARTLVAANAYALSQIDEALRSLIRDKHPDIAGITVIPKDRAA